MNFSDYKDAQDFLQKSGLDPDSAITFLDNEIKKIGDESNGIKSKQPKSRF